jgi:hypothetical protein
MTVLDPESRIQVAGLASRLPNGHYTYDLRPLDRAQSRQFHLPLDKAAASITIPIPSPGLYRIMISDSLNSPRIELFVAAVTAPQAERFNSLFGKARALLAKWNEIYRGWPVHEFQQAYLEWLVFGPKAFDSKNPSGGNESGPSVPSKESAQPGRETGLTPVVVGSSTLPVTAEPAFSPNPGLLPGETEITLHCATPGASIHYTVDLSQPLASSSVYAAPIIVKGPELTIKAFASAPGKKDSPVVTGIFRIEE